MTAGAAVILGPTGVNIGAGMFGGALFVLDEEGDLDQRINADSVAIERELQDEAWLYDAITVHAEVTGSAHASALLRNWGMVRTQFRRISPRENAAIVQLPPMAIKTFDLTFSEATCYTRATS